MKNLGTKKRIIPQRNHSKKHFGGLQGRANTLFSLHALLSAKMGHGYATLHSTRMFAEHGVTSKDLKT